MKLNISKIDKEIKRLGLSRPQFAALVGISKQSVYYIYVKESTSFGMIERLAKVLDMDPKDLLI